MGRKAVSGVMLRLFLIGMLMLAFNIQPVRAEGTVYIRADGSVSPPTAPVSSADNVTYTFTGNIYDSVVVERDNIVVDGAGYTVQGTGGSIGILLTMRTNVTIKNVEIKAFANGIFLYYYSSSNNIVGNNVINNGYGIRIDSYSNNNTVKNNIITNNGFGIFLYYYSSSNNIAGNIITNNGFGIQVDASSSNSIVGNNITANNRYGVWFDSSSSNSIVGNNITANNDNGAWLYNDSSNNTITENNITANTGFGIRIDASSSNSIAGNNITANDNYGILLYYSSSNNIVGNNITNNVNGIWLYYYSSDNNIAENNITANDNYGILLYYSSNNNISGNNIAANNVCGILLYSHSSTNSIFENNMANNLNGILLYNYSSNNLIYHNNFVNNTPQVYITESVNVWNDGYPSGGNYWSNYTDVDNYSGPYQNETGSDGIGDTPYVIDASNQDRYPLINPWGSIKVFNVTLDGENYYVIPLSNSTITHFNYNQSLNQISFNVASPSGTTGFCNLTIPRELVNETFIVLVNNFPVDYIQTKNETHYFLYFAYTHSIRNIKIIYGIYIQITLTTAYEINLYVNGTFKSGNSLKVKFYSYSGVYQGEVTVWTGTTPTQVILSVNVMHPFNQSVQIATLMLSDNAGNILQIITSFVVRRSDLISRLATLDTLWALGYPKPPIFQEIIDIDAKWPYAPT